MGTNNNISLDETAMRIIRIKAAKLVDRYGFTKSDREDLVQDLTLDLLSRLGGYDPRKGKPATYLHMIVNRGIASLIRARMSMSRDYRRVAHSLHDSNNELYGSNHRQSAMDSQSRSDLKIDMAEALDALPDRLRSIAQDLCERTVADTARKRRCGREVVRHAAGRIRQHLSDRGLDEYVEASQRYRGSSSISRMSGTGGLR